MFNIFRFFKREDRLFGAKRSYRWSSFREVFLKNKTCAVCGGTKKLELHHKQAFNTNPELELEPTNVIPLCEAKKYGINCHLLMGHLGNYSRINPDIESDAIMWHNKLKVEFK